MKTLLLILLCSTCHGQTNDTIPTILFLMDTTHKWEYFNKNGTLAWRKDFYDGHAIPVGGYAVKGKFLKPTEIVEDGFYVVTTTNIPEYVVENGVVAQYYKSQRTAYLRADRKRIQKPYILKYTTPVDGADFIR